MPDRTILLIDDHTDSRVVYSTILRHSGYRVVEAIDGREGLRMAREQKPDVILMDVELPYVDGLQATAMLKADPATAHIPVIAVSAHLSESDRLQVDTAGCDGFLPKPCPPLRLVQEIQRILPEA